MTRKLMLCAALAACLAIGGPAMIQTVAAQVVLPQIFNRPIKPLTPVITPVKPLPAAVPSPTPTPSAPATPTLWTIQPYRDRGAPDWRGDAVTATSTTVARNAAVAACDKLAVDLGKTASERAAIKAAVPSFRALGGEADSTYFPCDITLNGVGGRADYVRVIAVKTGN